MESQIYKIILIFTILSLATSAQAREWSQSETIFESVLIGLVVADMAQTDYLLDRGWKENNIIYGAHPTDARLYGTALVGMALHIYLVDRYPQYSGWLQWGLLAGEIRALSLNQVRISARF